MFYHRETKSICVWGTSLPISWWRFSDIVDDFLYRTTAWIIFSSETHIYTSSASSNSQSLLPQRLIQSMCTRINSLSVQQRRMKHEWTGWMDIPAKMLAQLLTIANFPPLISPTVILFSHLLISQVTQASRCGSTTHHIWPCISSLFIIVAAAVTTQRWAVLI